MMETAEQMAAEAALLSRLEQQVSACDATTTLTCQFVGRKQRRQHQSQQQRPQIGQSWRQTSATRTTTTSQMCPKNLRRSIFPPPLPMASLALLSLLCALLASQHLFELANCAKLPDIYWNASNPIFRIDNTDHIFDVNKKQHDHDQVDLVCPQPAAGAANNKSSPANSSSELPAERYIIYSVSKEEYDTCRLVGQNPPRVIALCDQPAAAAQSSSNAGRLSSRPPVTVTFRSFTPQPNGLEFKAGQDYYFITALFGSNLDQQRRFAPCREQNMKVIFKVCCKAPAAALGSNSAPSASSGAAATSTTTSASTQQARAGPANQAGGFRSSTRRPTVITLRPSLAPPSASKNSLGGGGLLLDEYFHQIGGNNAFQQQQPITVLPIEVLQPSTEPPQPSSSSEMTPNNNNDNNERNDIVQNEQQQPAAPTPATAPAGLWGGLNSPQGSPNKHAGSARDGPTERPAGTAFMPFDPTASPEVLKNYERWLPTPLPPNLKSQNVPLLSQHQNHLNSNSNNGYHQQQQVARGQLGRHFQAQPPPQPEQAAPLQFSPGHTLRTHLQQQQQQSMQQRPSGPSQSRFSLYSPRWPQYEQPASIHGPNGFGLEQQQQSAAAASSASPLSAPTAVGLLLSAALLLLLSWPLSNAEQHFQAASRPK